MMRVTKWLAVAVSGIAALCLSPRAYGICQYSQPAMNPIYYFSDCPDSFPVAAFLGVVGSADTINNNGIDLVCEDGAGRDGAGIPCSPDVGSAGDGRVMIQFDWANQDFSTDPPTRPLGCPDPAGLPGIGRNFAGIVCNDGAAAIITVDYDIGIAGYEFDFATRLDPGTDVYTLHFSSARKGLSLVSFDQSGGTDTACIVQTAPVPLYSDCDPESAGSQFGLGCTTPAPTVAPGANLYLVVGPATAPPTDLRVAAWMLQPTTPGPDGSKCVGYPAPPEGECAWIGSTAVLAGQDTGAIAGWITICAPPLAHDLLMIDSATIVRGTLEVEFSTENESLITGFNVYAGSTRLNADPIPAKGTGSNSYIFRIGRGALKSTRTVFVEAVKSDGTVERTAPVSLK